MSIWNLDRVGTAPITLRASSTRVRRLAFNHDGQKLITGDDSGVIRTWDFRQAPEIPLPPETGGQVGAFDLSADGRLLAAGDDSREVLVWDLGHIDRSPIATLKVAEDITHLAFDTVGQRLAAASRSDVWVWDLGRVTVPPRRFQGPPEWIKSSFSPDGRRLAAGVQGGVILSLGYSWPSESDESRSRRCRHAHTDRLQPRRSLACQRGLR